jgi:predicted metalloprotease
MARFIAFVASVFALVTLASAPNAAADDFVHFQYAVDQFAVENGLPVASWVNVPSGQNAESACVTMRSEHALFYCRADRLVYIGDDANRALVQQVNWLAPGFAAAHEWGHSLWDATGVIGDRHTQAIEDGADCVGGAWLAWYSQRAGLGLSLHNLPDLDKLVHLIGRTEQHVGDIHGLPHERRTAIINGFVLGLGACEHWKNFV